METKRYCKFEQWLNDILKDYEYIPLGFCFNLYENVGGNFSMELIASDEFEREDREWICSEIYATRDKYDDFYFYNEDDWVKILDESEYLVSRYKQEGKYNQKLKSAQGVAVGFVDGDITLLYAKES